MTSTTKRSKFNLHFTVLSPNILTNRFCFVLVFASRIFCSATNTHVNTKMETGKYDVFMHGTCDARFKSVKDIFYQTFQNGDEDAAQLCIYVGKTCVVDLYGTSKKPDRTYGPDTFHVRTYFSYNILIQVLF